MEILNKEWYPFEPFGIIHSIVLCSFISSIVVLYWLGRNSWSDSKKRAIGLLLSFLPLFAVIARIGLQYLKEDHFNIQTELPLYLCRIMAFLIPVLMFVKSQKLFAILYFSILAGTLNAILTPDIDYGFPHWSFWLYWLLHAGLVLAILFQVFVYKYRPKHSDIWLSFIFLNVYLVLVHSTNYLLESNYSYTMHKPPNPSILDFFGPWPVYLLVIQFIGVALFYLAYLPFVLQRADSK